MVLVSAVTCLAVLHNLGSVGIGTIIAAVLAGTVVGIITKAFGKQRDKILGKTDEDLRCKERHTNIDYYVCMPFFIISPKLNCSQFSEINCSISENISLSQISHLLNAANAALSLSSFFRRYPISSFSSLSSVSWYSLTYYLKFERFCRNVFIMICASIFF